MLREVCAAVLLEALFPVEAFLAGAAVVAADLLSEELVVLLVLVVVLRLA